MGKLVKKKKKICFALFHIKQPTRKPSGCLLSEEIVIANEALSKLLMNFA